MKPSAAVALCVVVAASIGVLSSCKEKKADQAAPGDGSGAAGHTDHAGDHGHAAGHGVAVVELGSSTIGAFEVKATRDEGQIVAGKDAPIDVTVTPAAGSAAKASAVRFWIGTEDAKGSVKARADIENPAEPDRWHTHAEIPDPIPAGARLWVEIEDDQGGSALGSFELKA